MPNEALGTIGLIANDILKRNSPKIQDYAANTEDHLWMVTAYVFDLARRMELIFQANEKFLKGKVPSADRALARKISAQNEQLQADGMSWEERARLAEQLMLELWNEDDGSGMAAGERHRRYLERCVHEPPAEGS